jgi:dihydroceramidase
MQLLDELSMIYLTSTTFFAMFSYGKSRAVKIFVLIFTISFSMFVTLYYYHLKDPVFHQNAFAILAATVIFKGVYVMECLLRPSRRPKNPSYSEKEQKRVDERDLSILHVMWALVIYGVASVGLGFLIWNLDNIYCSNLRRWRRDIGLPWGIVLEGHGWW